MSAVLVTCAALHRRAAADAATATDLPTGLSARQEVEDSLAAATHPQDDEALREQALATRPLRKNGGGHRAPA